VMGLLSNPTFGTSLDRLTNAGTEPNSQYACRPPRQAQIRLSEPEIDAIVACYLDGLTL